MRAQAVVAVDGPNTKVSVKKLYGQPAHIDYRILREALRQDASARLGAVDFDYKTTVFLQESARTQRNEEGRQSGLAAFERVLSSFGWQVSKKTTVDSPAELVDAYARLDDALTTFGYKAVGRIQLALRELAAARQDRCECIQVDAKQDLRDASRDLVMVYGSHYSFATRLVLRLFLPVLVACANFVWARKMLERILVKAWLNISTAERGQIEYAQRVREALAFALSSNLAWAEKPQDLDLTTLSDRTVISLAHKVRAELRSERNQLHRAGDVDDILSDWVRQQIKPDVAKAAELPAVVYLVGNDYKNHLVMAERMQRYGAQVVLVLLERHLARANPATIAQVQSYPTIRLESFIEGCCGRSVAA
jgi:hypothetical protein